ncbi:MAG: hypothetical protein AVDCRST_MAG23-1496, partial [uncultured Sphingosinicella sp.]
DVSGRPAAPYRRPNGGAHPAEACSGAADTGAGAAEKSSRAFPAARRCGRLPAHLASRIASGGHRAITSPAEALRAATVCAELRLARGRLRSLSGSLFVENPLHPQAQTPQAGRRQWRRPRRPHLFRSGRDRAVPPPCPLGLGQDLSGEAARGGTAGWGGCDFRDARARGARRDARLAAVPERRADQLPSRSGGGLHAHLRLSRLRPRSCRSLARHRSPAGSHARADGGGEFHPVRLHRRGRAAQAAVRHRCGRLRRPAPAASDCRQSRRWPPPQRLRRGCRACQARGSQAQTRADRPPRASL